MVEGLHHITLICSDAQRTIDFYTQMLGLRLIKLTVNFDDPGSYHLYFGDEHATPGSAITFFVWPGAPRGRAGIGGTHHFALTVHSYENLLRWKRRLTDRNIRVDGPFDRRYFQSIYFQDPDGTHIEIATTEPGFTLDERLEELGTHLITPPARVDSRAKSETWPEPVSEITFEMALRFGMHHISAFGTDLERTHEFYHGLLGMRRVKMAANFDDPSAAHWFWGNSDGRPGTLISYFEYKEDRMRRARMGAGVTHHFALAVPDDETQVRYREKLMQAGLNVSPLTNRIYFHSIYTNDPDGHIVELATRGPGFAVDESLEELGTSLKLPPWYEQYRPQIEAQLPKVTLPVWKGAATLA